MSPTPNISIIIVGGGPVGLSAAHAFSQLGIDFTLLERRATIEEDVGASIVLWPHGMRILAQLGLSDQLLPTATELLRGAFQTKSGKIFSKTKALQLCKTNHGILPQMLARSDLISILYHSLPPSAKSKVHTSKTATSITSLSPAGGIKVLCSDNTTYTGTFLIGADGINSIVRKTILSSSPTLSTVPQLKTRYSLLWFSLSGSSHPLLSLIPTHHAFEVHLKDIFLQIMASRKKSNLFCFVYQLLPPDYDSSKRLTEKDVERMIATPAIAALPLGESGLTIEDVWPLRTKFGITPLEEGILQPEWHYKNQMVVIGDAAHKVTPTNGQGYNMGLVDIVSLANHVSGLMDVTNGGRENFLAGLEHVFKRYRAERIDSVEADVKKAGMVTRTAAWRDWRFKLFDRLVMPIPGVDTLLVNKVNCPIIAKGLVFNGIKVAREPFEGRIEWKEKMPLLEENGHDEKWKDSGEIL